MIVKRWGCRLALQVTVVMLWLPCRPRSRLNSCERFSELHKLQQLQEWCPLRFRQINCVRFSGVMLQFPILRRYRSSRRRRIQELAKRRRRSSCESRRESKRNNRCEPTDDKCTSAVRRLIDTHVISGCRAKIRPRPRRRLGLADRNHVQQHENEGLFLEYLMLGLSGLDAVYIAGKSLAPAHCIF